MSRSRMKNVTSKDFARMGKSTKGRGRSVPNGASHLSGLTMDSGYGTTGTNGKAGVGISTRGSREAFDSPAGPGGRW